MWLPLNAACVADRKPAGKPRSGRNNHRASNWVTQGTCLQPHRLPREKKRTDGSAGEVFENVECDPRQPCLCQPKQRVFPKGALIPSLSSHCKLPLPHQCRGAMTVRKNAPGPRWTMPRRRVAPCYALCGVGISYDAASKDCRQIWLGCRSGHAPLRTLQPRATGRCQQVPLDRHSPNAAPHHAARELNRRRGCRH